MCIYKKHCQGPSIKYYVKFTKKISIFYSLMPTRTCTYFFNDFLRCVTSILFFERKPDRKNDFLSWLLVLIGVYNGCIYIFDKNSLELATTPKNTPSHREPFQNCPNVFWTYLLKNTPWMNASAECTSQTCTDWLIMLWLWCSLLWKQLRSANKLKKIYWSPQEDNSIKKFTPQPKFHTLWREQNY